MNRTNNISHLMITSQTLSSYKDVLDDLRPAAAAAAANDDDEVYDDESDGDNDDDVVHDSTLPSHKVDEAPQDLDAFFVHPLTAATRATGDGDALALLHEYRNLPVIDFHQSTTGRLKSSLSSSSSSSLSSADMINSDRVTSSSDDLNHMITSSPPSAATRRHRDVMPDDEDVDYADDDDEKDYVLSDSASRVFTHLQTPINRAKLKEIPTSAELDEVVSSQCESREDVVGGHSGGVRRLPVRSISDRLQRQNSTANDAARNGSTMIASPSSQRAPAAAVVSQTRRKRKQPSSQSHCVSIDRCHDSQSSFGKLIRKDITADGYSASYQLTAKSATPGSLQDYRGYYEQLGSTNPRQDEVDYRWRQTSAEIAPQLRGDLRSPPFSAETGARLYCGQTELQTGTSQDPDVSPCELEYLAHDEPFGLDEYYGDGQSEDHCEQHEKANMSQYSRQRPTNIDQSSLMSQYYKPNNPGPRRGGKEVRGLSQYYGDVELRPSLHREGDQYSSGKTGLQFASRCCEVTSTVTHRPHHVVLKSSPDDPDVEDQNDTPPLVHSLPALPSSTGYYWSTGYSGRSVRGMKDVEVWRADPEVTAMERGQSFTATSPIYESCDLITNYNIKVEDALSHDMPPASLPVTSPPLPVTSSFSLPISVDDHFKRDLLPQQNVSGAKQRRRRRHNASVSAGNRAPSTDTSTRLHSSTTASGASSASAAAACTSPGAAHLPAKLPFSLPPVPPGYRLVITHRPTPESTDDTSHVTQLIIDHPSDSSTLIHTSPGPALSAQARSSGGGDNGKLRVAAERPQSLNIARSSGSSHASPSPISVVAPRQLTPASQTDRPGCDIVEQSLRAANVLADFSAAGAGCPPMPPRTVAASSLSLACTATSSVAASVAHPLASAGDCVLDYSQQQRLNRRRHSDLMYGPRHSLTDIVTPTSDVTTASSPSETLSQDEGWSAAAAAEVDDKSRARRPRHLSSTSFEAVSSFTRRSHISVIPKIEDSENEYSFYLEAAISTSKQVDEDRLTYLNKGQYYGLVMMHNPSSSTTETSGADFQRKSTIVKSVVMVLFRERHSFDEEQTAWELWHLRQHSFKQRVIDVDAKVCGGTAPLRIDEIAYNAVAVIWNARDRHVKVNIAVNCLSTDFSHQKGIKGSPLHLQIDTFEESCSSTPVHRAYSQIKVFCDKGADRKSREEERKLVKRSVQVSEQGDRFQKPCDRTYFYSMADLGVQPLLFHPHGQKSSLVTEHDRHSLMRSTTTSSASASAVGLPHCDNVNSYSDCASRFSTGRSLSCDSAICTPQRVLLYVREQHDHVFTALILESLTVHSLLLAIQEKYNVPYQSVKNVYRRSKKSLLVHLDDNFIRHFPNESTFIIDITATPHNSTANTATAAAAAAADPDISDDDSGFDITLTEIDVYSSAPVKQP